MENKATMRTDLSVLIPFRGLLSHIESQAGALGGLFFINRVDAYIKQHGATALTDDVFNRILNEEVIPVLRALDTVWGAQGRKVA